MNGVRIMSLVTCVVDKENGTTMVYNNINIENTAQDVFENFDNVNEAMRDEYYDEDYEPTQPDFEDADFDTDEIIRVSDYEGIIFRVLDIPEEKMEQIFKSMNRIYKREYMEDSNLEDLTRKSWNEDGYFSYDNEEDPQINGMLGTCKIVIDDVYDECINIMKNRSKEWYRMNFHERFNKAIE